MSDRIHILVVDDDEDIRDIVALVLESAGYQVTLARDGFEALKTLEQQRGIGLVLLDLMMPGMDGAHFLKLAREAHAVHAPIVILSGHASVFEKAAALAADGCLKKPISLDELLAAVKKHTEARTKP